jgi:hypothetical protein
MPGKKENISETNKEQNKQSDQPQDVPNENTGKGDDALDPGIPFPESGVKPD